MATILNLDGVNVCVSHWASWADCLPMIHERHQAVAALLVERLENPGTPCLQAVASAARDLTVGSSGVSW